MSDSNPAPSTAIDPQVAAIIASIGNNSTASVDDPPIYFGRAPRSVDTELGRFHSQPVPAVTKPLSEYNKQFYALDKSALINFQQKAQQAGLYGNSTPRLGDYDEDTYKLWQNVGLRAARFYAAGQQFTPADVLDMAIQSAPATVPNGGQGRAYATRTDVVNVQDAATIRDAAHAAFKSVTGKGRPISDKKVEQFVSAFTQAQVGAQRGVNAAQDRAEAQVRAAQATADAGGNPTPGPISQEVQLTMPDLSSRAAEFARNADPAGAGAHDIAGKFAMFTQLLGGIV